jgi:cobalamin biosynthesis protein CobW
MAAEDAVSEPAGSAAPNVASTRSSDQPGSGAQCLVVSGFLGSGKTTLVRRLLEDGQASGVRTAVVSNEFGDLGIDEALLAPGGGDYVELAGGCVCCRLSDDLLRTLDELWQRSRPERVIVETSGLALPYDTLLNFWRDPVRGWAQGEIAVVVVSAEQVAAGRELSGTFEDQVCSADLLLLSKTDLVDAGDAERVEARLRAMQPDVEIVRANHGEADPRVFFPPDAAGPRRARPALPGTDPKHSHDHDEFESSQLHFPPGTSASEVELVLRTRGALRAKGFVATAEGLRLVQGVAGRIELSVPSSPPPQALLGRVVVIERRRGPARTRGNPGTETTPIAKG